MPKVPTPFDAQANLAFCVYFCARWFLPFILLRAQPVLVSSFQSVFRGMTEKKEEVTPTFSLLLYFAGGGQTPIGKGHNEKKGFDLDSDYRLHGSYHVDCRRLRRVQEGG
jgi:hypothetical protein